MRRLVNSFLGLGALDSADADDLDPLADHVKNANNTDRTTADGNGAGDKDDSGNVKDDDDGGDTGASRPRQPTQPKGSMSIANARADKLVGHVDETCRALARPDLDPLNLESAIRIHLFVNVFFAAARQSGKRLR
jgi:hypothetical protein